VGKRKETDLRKGEDRMKTSRRAEGVPASATIAVTARAQQLKAAGVDNLR